jgi:Holliday junction resolvase
MSFQSKLIKDYKKKGYIVLKHIRCNENGFPDLQIMKDGVSVFIECKEGNDTIKPLQRYQIDRLISKGFEAYCLHETKGVIYPVDNEKIKKNESKTKI